MNEKIEKIFRKEIHIFCWFIFIGLLLIFIGIISKNFLVLTIILWLLISFYPVYIIGKFSARMHYKVKALPQYYDFKLSGKQLRVAWIEALIIIGSLIFYLPRTQGEPLSAIEMKQWLYNILKIAVPVLLVGGILIYVLRDKTK